VKCFAAELCLIIMLVNLLGDNKTNWNDGNN
jgi:hypothetical protein